MKTTYTDKLNKTFSIDGGLYEKFNVKRGLRNADSTGVLVGLTKIGDVHGYDIIDGKKTAVEGKLFYRGYDVEDLVKCSAIGKRYNFEQTVYLLLFGSLPGKSELEDFCSLIGDSRTLPRNFAEDSILKLPSMDIMNKLARSVLTLYSYDKEPENRSAENVLRQCIELIARFPTIVAYCYMAKKHYFDHESLIIHVPDKSTSTAESILGLIRHDQKYSTLEAEILDMALILHAEHGGGNNSTFSVHVVSSADTDIYSVIAAGLGSLKGYKHGGANIKVTEMMENIKKNVKQWDSEGEVADYLERILNKKACDRSGLIYGQGHAVYTISDPRTLLLRNKAALLAEEKGLSDEYKLYRLIERLAPEVFVKVKKSDKTICTNVDFYSGFVYRMLGIPMELYTALFAISRISGWCAHLLEETIAGGRIIRPAYKCVQERQKYVPISDRG